MEISYILKLQNKYKKTGIKLSYLPEWCKYPLAFADQWQYFVLPHFELLSQQLIYSPFFIDLIQIKAEKPTPIPFDINSRQLFLYFTLKGSLLYENEIHHPIINTRSNTFLMSYYDQGTYSAHAPIGIHICLIVSILPEWIESMYHDYPNLQYIMQLFKNDSRSYDTMYQCRMGRKIHRWLYKIYTYSKNNIGALDGNLRKYISYLLEYYDRELDNQNTDLAYKIKVFVQEHYRDNNLTIEFIADNFFITSRTLLNIFKRQYHMNVQEFLTDLRMTSALQMMAQGISIKDVYMDVGYADERSFRSALERYRKRNE